MKSVEHITQGKQLVDWKALSRCFAVWRGIGFNYNTLLAWRTMEGFPYVREKRRCFYDPVAVWKWYTDTFGSVREAS